MDLEWWGSIIARCAVYITLHFVFTETVQLKYVLPLIDCMGQREHSRSSRRRQSTYAQRAPRRPLRSSAAPPIAGCARGAFEGRTRVKSLRLPPRRASAPRASLRSLVRARTRTHVRTRTPSAETRTGHALPGHLGGGGYLTLARTTQYSAVRRCGFASCP